MSVKLAQVYRAPGMVLTWTHVGAPPQDLWQSIPTSSGGPLPVPRAITMEYVQQVRTALTSFNKGAAELMMSPTDVPITSGDYTFFKSGDTNTSPLLRKDESRVGPAHSGGGSFRGSHVFTEQLTRGLGSREPGPQSAKAAGPPSWSPGSRGEDEPRRDRTARSPASSGAVAARAPPDDITDGGVASLTRLPGSDDRVGRHKSEHGRDTSALWEPPVAARDAGRDRSPSGVPQSRPVYGLESTWEGGVGTAAPGGPHGPRSPTSAGLMIPASEMTVDGSRMGTSLATGRAEAAGSPSRSPGRRDEDEPTRDRTSRSLASSGTVAARAPPADVAGGDVARLTSLPGNDGRGGRCESEHGRDTSTLWEPLTAARDAGRGRLLSGAPQEGPDDSREPIFASRVPVTPDYGPKARGTEWPESKMTVIPSGRVGRKPGELNLTAVGRRERCMYNRARYVPLDVEARCR